MRRDELEHIIRAAGAIINDKHLMPWEAIFLPLTVLN
jgi:hypothetical protein